MAARLSAIAGVQSVQQTGDIHYRLTADHDVRPEAARAVVAAERRADAALGRGAEPRHDLYPVLRERTNGGGPPCSVRARPGQGLGTVVLKELADHLGSGPHAGAGMADAPDGGGAALYRYHRPARDHRRRIRSCSSGSSPSTAPPLPSFMSFLASWSRWWRSASASTPVNGEHNRRTLSRVLAQPIYRDALLAGKFIAGLATLAITLVCLWLLVVGLGVLFLGVPPSGEEIVRSLVFLAIAVFYGGVWLAVAMLFSVLFRSPATAALLSLGLWLFMSVAVADDRPRCSRR